MSTVSSILDTMAYGPAPEDASLVNAWLDKHNRSFGVYIGGEWLSSGESFETFNPATGEAIGTVAQADSEMVDKAVGAARAGLSFWQGLTGAERGKYLYAIARQIQKHSRLFAVLETIDNGKPIRETRDLDIPLVARHFYYHAGWARMASAEFPDYEPVGVCGQIIPWNFPLLMMAWKIAPALAMGNTVVLKPAEFTSLTALLFAEICDHVGLPKGVVNIITGDGETGRAIVEHPDVDKIAFTGSTEVGRIIREATASTHKKLSLELGGKSPFIIFEDTDLDSAVEGLVDAIWFNQGQVCCAGSRLLIQEGIAEKAYAKIRDRMDKLRVGNPLDKAVDIGAIVDLSQLKRITELVQQGVTEGATIYQGACELPETGWFYPPTLLTNVEPASTVAQVEIFGPVLVAMTFRTPVEAVALANNTPFGLASSVWTQSLDVAHDIAAQIKAGTVWVNCTNQFDASVGFGGYRESGFGREGGREGLFEYLKFKIPNASPTETPVSYPKTSLDRTHKLFIGGKQVRPDSGYSFTIEGQEFARANRKDVRNAVETASASWASTTAFSRAQILYYLAENLSAAKTIFTQIVSEQEFDASLDRVLHYAAWADKYEGSVHQIPSRAMVYTRNEPLGTVGVFAPESSSLLGLLSSIVPLIAMGNSVVCVASRNNPLAAVELYRIIEASDFPAGVISILTGVTGELEKPLSEHLGVDAIWHFGSEAESFSIQRMSSSNLKQTFVAQNVDWFAEPGEEWLRRATQVKNIWVPYGA
jgi:aldehyde dehydrogenase (NAD+)